jgi:hypothetical protein
MGFFPRTSPLAFSISLYLLDGRGLENGIVQIRNPECRLALAIETLGMVLFEYDGVCPRSAAAGTRRQQDGRHPRAFVLSKVGKPGARIRGEH